MTNVPEVKKRLKRLLELIEVSTGGKSKYLMANVVCGVMRHMALATVMYIHLNNDTLPTVGMSHGSHAVD